MTEPLRPCKDCGSMISRHAKACPNCGRPKLTPEERSALNDRNQIIGFVKVVCGLGLLWLLWKTGATDWAVHHILMPIMKNMFGGVTKPSLPR